MVGQLAGPRTLHRDMDGVVDMVGHTAYAIIAVAISDKTELTTRKSGQELSFFQGHLIYLWDICLPKP